MSNVPNPLIPGVSMMYPSPATGNISENVVVCIPLLCAVEISPVLTFCSGRMALMRVDFPTPEWPENKVTFPSNACLISSTPVPSKAEIR